MQDIKNVNQHTDAPDLASCRLPDRGSFTGFPAISAFLLSLPLLFSGNENTLQPSEPRKISFDHDQITGMRTVEGTARKVSEMIRQLQLTQPDLTFVSPEVPTLTYLPTPNSSLGSDLAKIIRESFNLIEPSGFDPLLLLPTEIRNHLVIKTLSQESTSAVSLQFSPFYISIINGTAPNTIRVKIIDVMSETNDTSAILDREIPLVRNDLRKFFKELTSELDLLSINKGSKPITKDDGACSSTINPSNNLPLIEFIGDQPSDTTADFNKWLTANNATVSLNVTGAHFLAYDIVSERRGRDFLSFDFDSIPARHAQIHGTVHSIVVTKPIDLNNEAEVMELTHFARNQDHTWKPICVVDGFVDSFNNFIQIVFVTKCDESGELLRASKGWTVRPPLALADSIDDKPSRTLPFDLSSNTGNADPKLLNNGPSLNNAISVSPIPILPTDVNNNRTIHSFVSANTNLPFLHAMCRGITVVEDIFHIPTPAKLVIQNAIVPNAGTSSFAPGVITISTSLLNEEMDPFYVGIHEAAHLLDYEFLLSERVLKALDLDQSSRKSLLVQLRKIEAKLAGASPTRGIVPEQISDRSIDNEIFASALNLLLYGYKMPLKDQPSDLSSAASTTATYLKKVSPETIHEFEIISKAILSSLSNRSDKDEIPAFEYFTHLIYHFESTSNL